MSLRWALSYIEYENGIRYGGRFLRLARKKQNKNVYSEAPRGRQQIRLNDTFTPGVVDFAMKTPSLHDLSRAISLPVVHIRIGLLYRLKRRLSRDQISKGGGRTAQSVSAKRTKPRNRGQQHERASCTKRRMFRFRRFDDAASLFELEIRTDNGRAASLWPQAFEPKSKQRLALRICSVLPFDLIG